MLKEIDFTYCPKCAGNFIQKAPNLLVCGSCDMHYYVNPRSTNAVILQNNRNEILLTKRSYEPHKGMFDLPGGFVNIHETIEESAIRELKEELNIALRLSDLTYICSCSDTYEFKGVYYFTIGMIFKARIPQEVLIIPADDVASIVWVDRKSIPYDDIAFKSIASVMKSYFSSKA